LTFNSKKPTSTLKLITESSIAKVVQTVFEFLQNHFLRPNSQNQPPGNTHKEIEEANILVFLEIVFPLRSDQTSKTQKKLQGNGTGRSKSCNSFSLYMEELFKLFLVQISCNLVHTIKVQIFFFSFVAFLWLWWLTIQQGLFLEWVSQIQVGITIFTVSV
jgi:hypothetical protein